jgi:hypothetical protein
MTHARFARRAALRQARRSATKGLIRRTLLAERLEQRSLLAADLGFVSDYWNQSRPTDVNADGHLAPIDAVLIINSLNSQGSRLLPQGVAGEGPQAASTPTFYDVNNDGHLSPIDAVIALNAEGEGPNGELVSYTVRALQPGTNTPLTGPIEIGQEYDLQVLVDDLRAPGTPVPPSTIDARGVFGGWVDILYNKSLTSVRVAEVQTVTLNRGAVRTGTFTLTVDTPTGSPETTGAISGAGNNGQTIAENIAAALGALPSIGGANNVVVTFAGSGNAGNVVPFTVQFIGRADVDFELISGNASGISGTATIGSVEDVKGDPTNPASFTEAFRSRAIPGLDELPSIYQSLLTAGDAADRISDVGAASNLSPFEDEVAGPDPLELVRARMKATAAGTLTFTMSVDVDDLLRPDHDTVLYSNEGEPPKAEPDLILLVSTTVTIVAGPLNALPDTDTIPEDLPGGKLINVLQNDSTNPPGGVIQLRSVGSAGAAGTTTIESGQVRFVPAANFSGTANFTYVIGIAGNTTTTATGSVSVTVTPVNDAPVNIVPGPQTVAEGGTLTLAGASAIRISDVDALATDDMIVTLTGGNGTVSLVSTTGLDFTVGDGTADTTMTFAGTIAEVNAALSGLTFTPTADFPPGAAGNASLTIATNDQGATGAGGALTTTTSLAITVSGVNDAPVVTLPAGPLEVASVSTLAFTGLNAISITDVDSAAGAIRTTIAVTSLGTGNPGTLTLGSTTGLNFTGGVGDGTNDATMTFTGTQAATDLAIKTLVYTPVDILTVTLTVTTNDQGNSGTGVALEHSDNVIIDVIPPSLPFARSDSRTIDEGSTTPLTIDVLARVLVNPGSQAILVGITPVVPSGGGTVAIDYGPLQTELTNTNLFDDTVIYTPPGGDINGVFSFTYTANEEPANSGNPASTGTVTIIINPVNDAPTANPDSYQASTDAPLVVPAPGVPGVLANDTDPENDPLTAVLVPGSGPASGTLSLNASGGFTYTPSGGGTFSFSYRARDAGGLESAPAIVTIAVSAPPTANPDGPFTATEDTVFTSTSLVANDQDFSIPPTPLTAVLETNVPTAAGSVVINSDNTFTYTPALNFNTTRPATGPVTFTYRASAAGRLSAPATVTINVTEVNDNPTAVDDTFQAVKRNGAVGVDQVVPVLLNDSSAPDGGETLTIESVSPATTPLGGSVRVDTSTGTPRILYTSPTVTGTDTFTYTINDGRGGTATATVTVTVVDFVPKDVSGRVYLDTDNDGVIDGTEDGLGGVEVRLTGTDFTNTAVALSAVTDANGNYSFVGLRPGNYSLQEIQPLYLLDGLDTESSPLVSKPAGTNDRFTMTWGATDQSGPITGVNFGERGIDIGSLADASGVIQELLSSSQPPEGFWVATDLSGNARWTFTLDGWENCAAVSFDLSSDLSSGILSVTDGNGAVHTRTMYIDPRRNTGPLAGTDVRFRIIGRSASGDYIIRIDGTSEQCGLSSFAAAAVPQGEGEAAQFAEAADAVFSETAWA